MIKIPRLPFREDRVFSILVLLTLVVPLVFDWELYEKYETIKLAFWLILIGWTAFLFFGQKIWLLKSRAFYVFLGTFVCLGFVSSLFSIGHINSFLGFYPRFTSGFLFYVLWALTLLIFTSVLDRERWLFLIKVIFLDAWVIAVVGILQSFGVGFYEGIEQVFITRAPGLLGNPNFSSMFLAAVLPFALPLLFGAKTFKAKVYYALGVFFMLWAIVNFSSRGTFFALGLGLVFGIILLSLLKFSRKILVWVFVVLICAVGFTAAFTQVTRPGSLRSALKLSEINIDTRLFAWDTARQAIFKYPLLGTGPGNLQIYFERFRSSNLASQAGVFDDAHNLFLQMAATTGAPFALSFLALLGLAIWRGYRSLKANRHDLWAAAGLVSLIIWLLASCFNPVSSANFLLLAISLSGLLIPLEKTEFTWFLPRVNKTVLKIFSLLLCAGGVMFLTTETLYGLGLVKYQAGQFQESQKFFGLALKINPISQQYALYKAADQIWLEPKKEVLQENISYLIKLQPESAKSYVMAANLSYLFYDKTGEKAYLTEAISYMEHSIEMDKYFTPRYTHLAFYLAEDNQLDLAREITKTGLMYNPKHLPSWLLLARIYQLEKKPKQAAYALNEAFKLNPSDSYLKQLNLEAKNEKNLQSLKIPALINIFQIDP